MVFVGNLWTVKNGSFVHQKHFEIVCETFKFNEAINIACFWASANAAENWVKKCWNLLLIKFKHKTWKLQASEDFESRQESERKLSLELSETLTFNHLSTKRYNRKFVKEPHSGFTSKLLHENLTSSKKQHQSISVTSLQLNVINF